MKAVSSLPEGYREYYSLNLQKDKKKAILVNGISLVIAVVMLVPMNFIVPISSLFSMDAGIVAFAVRIISFSVLSVLYLVIHELVHGIAMKLCGTQKVKYGFTGMYAFAGSDDYYGKKPYIFIALAPVVLLGIVFTAVNFFVPTEWVWVIYGLQIFNISGAAGDYFVTLKFSRFPKDILIRDHGVGMVVYSRNNN
ncbi:MAG: DUF3267 domain-containing protein [Clostridia bacterium]|nr:DUF3267 domain-containing protein [Clostridia bacterium]